MLLNENSILKGDAAMWRFIPWNPNRLKINIHKKFLSLKNRQKPFSQAEFGNPYKDCMIGFIDVSWLFMTLLPNN